MNSATYKEKLLKCCNLLYFGCSHLHEYAVSMAFCNKCELDQIMERDDVSLSDPAFLTTVNDPGIQMVARMVVDIHGKLSTLVNLNSLEGQLSMPEDLEDEDEDDDDDILEYREILRECVNFAVEWSLSLHASVAELINETKGKGFSEKTFKMNYKDGIAALKKHADTNSGLLLELIEQVSASVKELLQFAENRGDIVVK